MTLVMIPMSHDAFVDAEFKALAEDYVSDVKAGGRQRMAALRSNTNCSSRHRQCMGDRIR